MEEQQRASFHTIRTTTSVSVPDRCSQKNCIYELGVTQSDRRLYEITRIIVWHTLCRAESLTAVPLWAQETVGFGSAWMRHSNSSRLPSSSWRMAGFFANVGAIPSICLNRNKLGWNYGWGWVVMGFFGKRAEGGGVVLLLFDQFKSASYSARQGTQALIGLIKLEIQTFKTYFCFFALTGRPWVCRRCWLFANTNGKHIYEDKKKRSAFQNNKYWQKKKSAQRIDKKKGTRFLS